MKKLGVLITVLLTSILLLIPIAPVQSNSVYLHSYTATPPIIDGNLNSFVGEWANAATQEYDTIGGTSLHGKIYVMNTQTDLFIAIEINDPDNDGASDYVQIAFDNDNDGTHETGDDILHLYMSSNFEDRYITSSIRQDQVDGGTNDGLGAASWGSSWTSEISHPLKSGDIGYDFQLSFGDIVGFTIRHYDNGQNSYWPDFLMGLGYSTDGYGDIGIDSPFTPVGGIYVPTDRLSILAPYIALVGLIGAVSTIFAIRRWR